MFYEDSAFLAICFFPSGNYLVERRQRLLATVANKNRPTDNPPTTMNDRPIPGMVRTALLKERGHPAHFPVCRPPTPSRLRPSCAPAFAGRLHKPTLHLVSCVLQSCVSPTACNTGKHSDNQEGVEATAAIDDLLAQAQSVITRLDAAVKNKYARDPEKLAAWKSASHTVKPEKRLQPPVKPTPPTP